MANVGTFIVRKANPWKKGGKQGAPQAELTPGWYIVRFFEPKDGKTYQAALEATDGNEDFNAAGLITIPWEQVIRYLPVEDVQP